MFWPTPQDYNEAIQFIDTNFSDKELRGGSVELTQLGLPRPITGAFASVYKIQGSDKDWAAKCFLNNLPDLQQRYKAIADFVHNDSLPYTLDFVYLQEGIRIKEDWYPILKMEWVEGEQLFEYVRNNLTRPYKLTKLADRFLEMTKQLREAGIAHGDLQHGNIIVLEDELYLVDYDGMYVPELKGWTSNELGHRNYQHPGRTKTDFDPSLDNFSAWVIYASLRLLSLDVSLWNFAQPDGECLLFRQADFKSPETSELMQMLESHECEVVRNLARRLHLNCSSAIRDVPELNWSDNAPVALPKSGKAISTKSGDSIASKKSGRIERGHQIPDWAQTADTAPAAATIQSSRTSAAPTLVFADNTLKLVEDPEYSMQPAEAATKYSAVQPTGGNSSQAKMPSPAIALPNPAPKSAPAQQPTTQPPAATVGSKSINGEWNSPGNFMILVTIVALCFLANLWKNPGFSPTQPSLSSSTQSNAKLYSTQHLINSSWESGNDLMKQHKYSEAAAAYKPAYNAAQWFYGSESLTTADIELAYATALNESGDYGSAQAILTHAVTRFRSALDRDKVADAQYQLAVNQYGVGNYGDALSEFKDVATYWSQHLYGSQVEEKLKSAQDWEQKAQTAMGKVKAAETAKAAP